MSSPSWLRVDLQWFWDRQDSDLLARLVLGEAEGEPYDGKLAVACVVRNRVQLQSWWGKTYNEVMLWPWQFSCFNEGSPRLQPMLMAEARQAVWTDCRRAATAVIVDSMQDVTDGATHYYAESIPMPGWAGKKMVRTVVVGAHAFFREG